ncbi:hypothetical protein MMC27_008779 [Xylographa pallens]|nr:hypothetical protein [Xylographa pallens]
MDVGTNESIFANPASYVNAVRKYSKVSFEESLYSGHGYESLAEFLHRGYDSETEVSRHIKVERGQVPSQFAWWYVLTPGQQSVPRPISSLDILAATEAPYGQLLFFRGYPSATWLATIGSYYMIDPEFYRRHLDFLDTTTATRNFIESSLPSSSSSILKLRLTTLGSHAVETPIRSQPRIDHLRRTAEKSMKSYRNKLKRGNGWRTGDSVVRRYTIHNEDQFSIDQAITIYFSPVERSTKKWFIIIFMDCGEDLRASPAGPWLDEAEPWKANFHSHFFPNSLHRSNIVLQPQLWKDNHPLDKKKLGNTQRMTQSASRLHLRYGRFLDSDIMSRNPIYALHELFAFVASAELQFLDLMAENLEKELGGQLNEDEIDLDNYEVNLISQSNILRARRLLEEHIQDLNEVLCFFRHKGDMITWSQSSQQEKSDMADAAVNDLEQDYQYLMNRAETLRLHCERAMTIAMNSASIAEARRGIQQGKSLFKFTVLASLYVPLSFTTSFFGMNIMQFGNGDVNIWIFFVVTLPIFGISALFLFYDWQKLHKLYRRWVAI